MAFPPGQGKSGSYLRSLWRRYLEHCADSGDNPQGQVLVGCYHASEIFGFMYQRLNPRAGSLQPGEIPLNRLPDHYWRADRFEEHLADASIRLYANLGALGEIFAAGNPDALGLIQKIEEEALERLESGSQIEKSGLALRASFPILSLMTLVIDQKRSASAVIRQLEHRFVSGAAKATTPNEQMLNAVYRMVEMMQIFVTLSDAELKDQVQQITARFQEEDRTTEPLRKAGNGFCRLFELGHLLTTHLDEILPGEQIRMVQNAELTFAIDTVRKAGDIILSYFHSSFEVEQKGKDNPVTSADLAADSFLREAFAERFPSDGWLSEESVQKPEQLQRPRIWVVDPLDGIKEFIKGLPEYAISVALLDEGKPALAVVYNPPQDELFVAERGSGAYFNGERVWVSKAEDFGNAKILASRSELSDRVFRLPDSYGSVKKTGSIAYKLALIASNEGDITISFRPKNIWDVCAGTLLVEEAGGRVTNFHGAALDFRPPYRLLEGIIAANPRFHQLAADWVAGNAKLDS